MWAHQKHKCHCGFFSLWPQNAWCMLSSHGPSIKYHFRCCSNAFMQSRHGIYPLKQLGVAFCTFLQRVEWYTRPHLGKIKISPPLHSIRFWESASFTGRCWSLASHGGSTFDNLEPGKDWRLSSKLFKQTAKKARTLSNSETIKAHKIIVPKSIAGAASKGLSFV